MSPLSPMMPVSSFFSTLASSFSASSDSESSAFAEAATDKRRLLSCYSAALRCLRFIYSGAVAGLASWSTYFLISCTRFSAFKARSYLLYCWSSSSSLAILWASRSLYFLISAKSLSLCFSSFSSYCFWASSIYFSWSILACLSASMRFWASSMVQLSLSASFWSLAFCFFSFLFFFSLSAFYSSASRAASKSSAFLLVLS